MLLLLKVKSGFLLPSNRDRLPFKISDKHTKEYQHVDALEGDNSIQCGFIITSLHCQGSIYIPGLCQNKTQTQQDHQDG